MSKHIATFLISVLLIFASLPLAAWAQDPMVGVEKNSDADSNLPENVPPPEAEVKQSANSLGFYMLPDSPTREGKDMCGNPRGTTYGEGFRCPNLEEQKGPYITYKSPWEESLTVIAALMAGGFALLYCAFHVLGRGNLDEWAARNFIVIAVVGSAVFVLTAGYDDKQAAPLYGLLGTLVGYLFGRAPQEQSRTEGAPRNGGAASGAGENAAEKNGSKPAGSGENNVTRGENPDKDPEVEEPVVPDAGQNNDNKQPG